MTKERIAELRAEIEHMADGGNVDAKGDLSPTCGELRELLTAAELVLTMEQVVADTNTRVHGGLCRADAASLRGRWRAEADTLAPWQMTVLADLEIAADLLDPSAGGKP